MLSVKTHENTIVNVPRPSGVCAKPTKGVVDRKGTLYLYRHSQTSEVGRKLRQNEVGQS